MRFNFARAVAALPVVVLIVSASVPARAVTIIDTFEEGPFSVSDSIEDGLQVTAEQSGLSASNVIGGVRLVRLSKLSSAAGAVSASLSLSGGDDATVADLPLPSFVAYDYDGMAGGPGSLNADLTGDNRFLVEITAFSGGSGLVQVNVRESGGGLVIKQQSVTGSGTFTFPFSLYSGVDFSNIEFIELAVGFPAPTEPKSYTISYFGAILFGDYNGDGNVDGADYTVWRDTLGNVVELFAGADGDGDGIIGTGDFTVWVNNFGIVSPGAGSGAASGAVPEPSSALLMTLAMLGFCFITIHRQGLR